MSAFEQRLLTKAKLWSGSSGNGKNGSPKNGGSPKHSSPKHSSPKHSHSPKHGGVGGGGGGSAASSPAPPKFTLPSDLAIRKGVRNPLDMQIPKLPHLYEEPANTLNQYARVDDAAHVRPSDRIARNYTATAKMLTIAAIDRSINPTAATLSDNPFSRADLQSINVPPPLDPLHIPLHPGKGSGTLAPSPKRTDRRRYNSGDWKPELHGALANSNADLLASSPTNGGSGGGGGRGAAAHQQEEEEEAEVTVLNFLDAVDSEDAEQVMPIKQRWVQRALKKVRRYQSSPGAEPVLLSCLDEVQEAYQRSIKTAIVKYKILSPRGARKVHVDRAVLDQLANWQPGQSRWNHHLTPEWRVLRETGIEEAAILASKEKIWSIFNTLGSAMCRLQQLWLSRVGGLRLCDNRFTNFDEDLDFQRSLPLRVPEFSQRLLQEVTRVRSALKTSWLVASGFILTQHLKYYKEALHFNLFGHGAPATSAPGSRTQAELQHEEKELLAAEEVSALAWGGGGGGIVW
jgi:hypothetical protein